MRLLHGTAHLFTLALLLVPPLSTARAASAGVCTYDSASHSVVIKAPATEIEYADYRLEAPDGIITFNNAPCGEATVTNTDSIHLQGVPADDPADEYLALYPPFAPGFTLEPDGLSEIEITLEFPYPSAYVDVQGTDGPDSITLGTLGYNLNGDDDLDVQISGVTTFDIEGYGGRDRISTAGGRGTGAAVPVKHYLSMRIYGFEGRDVLINGPFKSLLSGGKGSDVLRGGGGNDVIDAIDWYGQDKLQGGTGQDRCYGTGIDSARGCERFLHPSSQF